MGTGNLIKTDIYFLNNVFQMTMLSHAKELFIETLRDIFSEDSYYAYHRDNWGFPLTPDLINTQPNAGLQDNVTTRIFIGEAFHYDMIFYPALLIRGGAFRSVPISMSRNEELVHYAVTRIVDGYGNEKLYSTPDYFSLSGAWEGSISIEVCAGDMQARDELVDIVCSILQIIRYKEFQKAGVFIKPPSISGPTESDDRSGKIYKQTITCDVRTEWNQRIPISTMIDSINFCVDFGDLQNSNLSAPNLEIKSSIDLLQAIDQM